MSDLDRAPGALIELDGTLNFRDLGGWPTADGSGTVARGVLYRSDRLNALSDADHSFLDGLGIRTVVDLRYEAEAAAHPTRFWSTAVHRHNYGMGGDLADQRSFIERALDGDYDGITDHDVAESYVDFLQTYGALFGAAIDTLLADGPGLFHCTAGKDRTGLLAMLMLRTVGVADDAVIEDFARSNVYRAERRMADLRPTFAEQGLDIEAYRPALSAPPAALKHAMEWIDREYETTASYLATSAGLDEPTERLASRLIDPAG